MDELKPLQRTDFTAMDGDFGPTLIRHTHPGGKWTDVENVQIREKMLLDALRKTQGWLTPEDRLAIGSLIEQFDAEENR